MEEKIKRVLIEKSPILFLRPDGLGKSNFLQKLENYFLQEQKIAVLRLSFGERRYKYPFDLDCVVQSALQAFEAVYRAEKSSENISEGERFGRSIIGAYEKTGKKCAVLIDDYDFPLLDDSADDKTKIYYESVLSSLYGALQTHKKYIESAFIAGMTRQEKILQHAKPNDLTDSEEFSAIFGLKETEIIDLVNGDSGKAEKIIRWYGGYSFGEVKDDKEKICSARSVISVLNTNSFCVYSPIMKMKKQIIEEVLLSSFDFSALLQKNGIECSESSFFLYENRLNSPLPSLYQFGVLTKAKGNSEFNTYFLTFPNIEMRDLFFTECSRRLTAIPTEDIKMWTIDALRALEADDLRLFFTKINIALKNIMPKKLRDAITTIFGLFSIYTDSFFRDGYFSLATPSYLHLIAFDLSSMQNAAERIYLHTIPAGKRKVRKTGVLISAEKGVISYRTI